jgi:hypothetical protein
VDSRTAISSISKGHALRWVPLNGWFDRWAAAPVRMVFGEVCDWTRITKANAMIPFQHSNRDAATELSQ